MNNRELQVALNKVCFSSDFKFFFTSVLFCVCIEKGPNRVDYDDLATSLGTYGEK